MLGRNQTQHYPVTMNDSSLKDQFKDQFGDDEPSTDDRLMNLVSDALSANDKVIEIRPAERSKRMGAKNLLLLGAGAIGLAFLIQKSGKPGKVVEDVKEGTADLIHQAAEAIEVGGEAASERIEESSERAGEVFQEAGEKAAKRTEEAGETFQEAGEEAAERTEKAGEEAAKRTEDASEEAADEMDDEADEIDAGTSISSGT